MSTTHPPVAPPVSEFVLGPATRLLWRSADSVHLELGTRAVIVEGLPPQAAGALVARIPSTEVASGAAADGPDPGTARVSSAFLAPLVEAGYLWPRVPDTDDPADRLPGGRAEDLRLVPPQPRLSAELAALAVQHGEGAAEVLSARHHASVQVCGDARVGVQLAAVLAASGVGRVTCALDGSTRLFHAAPGGLVPADEGRPLAAAADSAVRRAAPEVRTAPPDAGVPDLIVLAGPVDDERRAALHAAGVTHLNVTLGADHGVVGPLVIPGLTSCLRCADLHRCDRDPAWPALAVQLTVPGRYAPPARAAVSTVIAGVAATQALAFLDGDEPTCVEATLELHLPDWQLRRRRWPVHPECTCCPVQNAPI